MERTPIRRHRRFSKTAAERAEPNIEPAHETAPAVFQPRRKIAARPAGSTVPMRRISPLVNLGSTASSSAAREASGSAPQRRSRAEPIMG
jgi:hypothetical protein